MIYFLLGLALGISMTNFIHVVLLKPKINTPYTSVGIDLNGGSHKLRITPEVKETGFGSSGEIIFEEVFK